MACVQPTEPERPFLLAADVDGTLLGDEEGEACLRAFVLRYPGSVYLAVTTGRSLSSVLGLVEEGRLPRPAYISSTVGTELADCDDPDNALGQRYAAQVSSAWDPRAIYTLGEGEGVRRQEFPEGQPRFQAGFDWDGRAETLAALRERLANGNGYHILPSHGQYIDVLPDPLGKGKVVQFLQKELGLDPARVVVAGDSGNDGEMFETGFKGIVPANALSELKAIACRPWHYASLFPAARGVLDGLCHFGFVKCYSSANLHE
jgi:sucrose-phosphate synthase